MSVESSDGLPASAAMKPLAQPLSGMPTLFSHIPSERIGPNGEYDYYGLSKRVCIALNESFSSDEIRNLKVRQRGAMIVLLGNVQNRRLLSRIVQVAASVEGAVGVELNGVSIVPPSTNGNCWDDFVVLQTFHQWI
ncbi:MULTISPECIES: hypothetical protein [unclassified Leptolyngbya]|uniref:hypothetical protein n=1 Tax=unclassified Leptolyngbya TaxID=2650499 RepID=UPI001687A611|nr:MULTISPECIES: hypothetical protein [unclassified Leptolyngbya]MBD1913083.1 hypothetical protein [Leptolyngbya sp. FACHB-8]MBD2154416.1 hypothetical protein [Leptolyngbya sp. FACHB-16]